ncbi:MAG: MATE family efflux transporter [Clostridia bacterium]
MSEITYKENKMGTHKMFPLIMSMAIPSMFSMLVQALYNIVDSYYVAKYSIDALSAVSLASPIQNLIIAFSVGTSIGVGSLVSRKLGEKNREQASSAVNHGIVLNVITWVIFLIFGLFFTRQFFEMFESNETIISMGTEYLSIVSACSIGVFISICFEKVFQSTGNMIYPMIIQLVGALTNIILDPILIFGAFGLPELGIKGAAIATVSGQLVSTVVALYLAFRKKSKHAVDISLRGFKFNKLTVKNIYAVGFPTIIMNAIGTVMMLSLNAILSGFSAAAYTVFGLYYKVQSFVFMPVFGLVNGLMPIFGYNYGAKNKKRIMSCMKIGCLIAIIINTLGMLMFLFFPRQLLSIFSATEEIYEIGIPAFRIICTCFIPAAVSVTLSTLFQAVGKGTYSLTISALRQLILIVPIAYFMSNISLTAVWFALPIAEIGGFIMTIILIIKVYNKQIKNL